MRTVKINELEIGAGKPKIAVPLIEATTEALINTAKQVCQEPIDMIEWRLDFFTNIHSIEAILKTARQLRRILDNRPLLVTLRQKMKVAITSHRLLNIQIFTKNYKKSFS